MTKLSHVPIPVLFNALSYSDVIASVQVFQKEYVSMKIVFNVVKESIKYTKDNSPEYYILFKEGDDMRQDQLILQLVSMMDKLLKKVSLDLKLTHIMWYRPPLLMELRSLVTEKHDNI